MRVEGIRIQLDTFCEYLIAQGLLPSDTIITHADVDMNTRNLLIQVTGSTIKEFEDEVTYCWLNLINYPPKWAYSSRKPGQQPPTDGAIGAFFGVPRDAKFEDLETQL